MASNSVSDKVKRQRGTWRADRVKKRPEAPFGPPPNCPGWLSPDAKAEWRRLAPDLSRLGLLFPKDRALFASYCEAWSRFKMATERLAVEGLTVTSPGGVLRPHPCVTQSEAAYKTMAQASAEFGFSPKDRANITLPAPPKPKDGKERFFRD